MPEYSLEDQILYKWQSARQVKNQHFAEHIHLARYVRPEVAESFEGRKPTDRPAIEKLWDDTAIKANDMFARGLWSMSHNSATEWFQYSDKADRVMNNAEAARWYQRVNTDLKTELEDSGVYSALLLRLSDVGAFGFGALYSYEDPDQPGTGKLIFEWVPASECFYTVGRNGLADSFIRPIELTARQAIDERGWSKGKLDRTVIDCYERRDESKKFLFLHVVWRNNAAPRGRPARESKEFAWSGYYYQVLNRKVLDEHGFRDFPYHVLGWGGASNVPYPVGIGYRTLPEIRNINAQRMKFDRLLDVESDSPILAPNSDEDPGGQFRPQPGEMIHGGMSGDGKRLYDPLFSGNGSRSLDLEIRSARQIIQEAWHYSLFLMQTQRQMTAEEVRSRDAKLIQAMGPFLVLMKKDLGTIIERLFFARLAAGVYDPMPSVFDADTQMDLKLSGLLAKAAQSLEGGQIVELYAEAAVIAQYDPDAVIHGMDHDAALRHLGSSKSIPRDIVRSAEEAKKRRDDAQMAKQQAMAAEMAPQMAKAAKDGSEAMNNLGAGANGQTGGALAAS